ncbi:MAG: VanW family protein, partial [Chloroflexota bacterium]
SVNIELPTDDGLQRLAPGEVVLRTRILEPALPDEGIAGAVADARRMLAAPLTLSQGERSWTWEPERIAELLAISVEDGYMTIDVDPQRLERAVEKLAQVVDSPSVEPRVAFRGERLQIVEEGHTGLRLKQDEAAEAIRAALRAGQRTVELPVAEVEPQITAETLPELGIVELVAEGKSSFAGSAPYRVTNILAGAARMNGVLIAPGEEFSFNTQLGAVDEANGFVQGYAVIGNRTQLEWGGGVCQVSTTVFRAAFWAGLPFTERHAHPFYISWYDEYSYPDQAGPGMDATIYTGVQDLRFVNDTGHWLLMEAVADVDRQVLTVRLYGTKPNRTVSIAGPTIENIVAPPSQPVYVNDPSLPAGTVKQTDTARRGMDITVYRLIEVDGQQRPPEAFFTRFKAWPNVFVRGTGT